MLLLMLKSNEFKGEIPGVTNLATIAAFTTVENKIPNFNDLVKKTYSDPKMSEMEKNILVLLIIISSRVIHMMQR